MSDPDAAELSPPVQPPRPAQPRSHQSFSTESQMAADERYARQLEEHYNKVPTSYPPAELGAGSKRNVRGGPPVREVGFGPSQFDDDRERSFIDGAFTGR